MESFDHQEERAREHLNIPVVIKAAMIAGGISFVLPGGGPWMSTEGFFNVMGRIVASNMIVDLPLHLMFSLIYGFIIGAIIYPVPTLPGIVLGTFLAIPLAGINYLIFVALLGYPANELHVMLCHIFFALVFSTVYRAMAVPKPLERLK